MDPKTWDSLSWEERIQFLKTHYRWDSEDVSMFDRQCSGKMEGDFYVHDISLIGFLNPQPHEVGLNLGCGTGRVEHQWAHKVKELHGVDFAEAMVRVARDRVRHPNVQFHQNDGKSLRIFPDNMFDFAWCELVFQHIPAELTCMYLAELHRVLKPGGRMCVQIPRIEQYGGDWDIGGMSQETASASPLKKFAKVEWLTASGGMHPADKNGQPFYLVALATKG